MIPLDPADLDKLPPEDLDRCDHCSGTGATWPTWDPQDMEMCPVCHGNGILPDYGSAA